MTVRVVLPLVVGDAVRDKIEARGIFEEHVDELVRQTYHPTHFRLARGGGLLALGRDRGGRYLVVALYPSRDYPGRHVLATAREATVTERRLYERHASKP